MIVGTETLAAEPDVDAVHAGTARRDGTLVTAGGRVLAVTAVGTTSPTPGRRPTRASSSIAFAGAQCRTDIAAGV